jgi:hypothetical protein
MGLFSRLAGTMSTFFQIGGVGDPGINANGPALETRNAANSAYAVHRAAAPVGANDVATYGSTNGWGTQVANIAALEVLSTAPFVTGALAYVATVGALWCLQTASALTTDGITVVNAAGGGQWVRGVSLITEAALTQTVWELDERNVSGTASDENTGITGATALRTKAEIARRLGSNNPFTNVAVTVTWLSVNVPGSAAAKADPWTIVPTCGVNGSWTLRAPLTGATDTVVAFTGSLLAVTAKSNTTTPGNALQSTFTTATGAMAAGLLLVNATHSSVAIAQRNLGGGNWQISQPTPLYVEGNFPTLPCPEVNTWTNGDAITGYALSTIDADMMGSEVGDYNAAFFNGMFVHNLNIGSSASIQEDDFVQILGTGFCFIEGRILKSLVSTSGITFNEETNVYVQAHLEGNSVQCNGGWFAAGIFQPAIANTTACAFASDIIYSSPSAEPSGNLSAHVGAMFIDTPETFIATDDSRCDTFPNPAGVPAVCYGPGTLNSRGPFNFPSGATGGTTSLRCTLNLNGKATGYSVTAGTVSAAQALSGAQLDAASGPAGFGGTATNLAGASFTNGTQN